MNIPRNYTTQAATLQYTLAKFGTADGTVVPAAAATDAIIGAFDELNHDSGDRADVVRLGRCLIKLGGTVTRGDTLTSDGNACAIKAVPAAGSNATTIGKAEVSGVAGDIIEHVLVIGSMQG